LSRTSHGPPKPSDEKLAFLGSQALLAGMAVDELGVLLGLMEEVTFEPGDTIIEEGEMLDDIFFLREGEVTIEKWDDGRTQRLVIGELGTGQSFGEMAVLDGSPRSSTIVAKGDVRALVLRTAFDELGPYRTTIVRNIALASMKRLRRTNDEYVSALRAELDQQSLANRFGRFFIAILFVLGVNNGLQRIVEVWGVDVKAAWFTWLSLSLLVLPILVFIAWFRYPLSTFGVTLANARPALERGAWVSAAMLLSFVLFRVVVHVATQGLEVTGPLVDTSNPRVFGPLLLLYAPHSALQEFASRGVVQTALQTFLRDERGHLAIGVTSLLFAILHLSHGVVAVLVTFFGSLAFGYVYRPHRNLLGVSLVHWVGGTIAEYAGWV